MLRSFAFAAVLAAASPVQAQLYWQTPDIPAGVLLAPEPGYGVAMPGANAAETKAAMTWALRSGLNVAALQCGFEPSLRTLENYNALLTNHREELAAAFTTLTGYFKRTSKTVKGGQNALDAYGTRTYSSFSAVAGQLQFCTAAGRVSNSAMFAPRGKLNTVAQERIRELYNGIKSKQGEQQFRPTWTLIRRPFLPNMDNGCWKKGKYIKTCGMVPMI